MARSTARRGAGNSEGASERSRAAAVGIIVINNDDGEGSSNVTDERLEERMLLIRRSAIVKLPTPTDDGVPSRYLGIIMELDQRTISGREAPTEPRLTLEVAYAATTASHGVVPLQAKSRACHFPSFRSIAMA